MIWARPSSSLSLTGGQTVTEIRELIPILYTEAPDVQRNVVANYFTSDASFTHPFFRIQGFPGSIWSIHMIYRWCKVLSPHLKVEVESAGRPPCPSPVPFQLTLR